MRSIFMLLLAICFSALTALGQTAKVQIIHNSPNPTVDVYVNGVLALNDFAFRTATPFLDLPADVDLSVAVAPASSTSVADALATFDVKFTSGKAYVVAASGLLGDPNKPFTLFVNDAAQLSATDTSKVDVAVLHGSPDAPAVDVDAVFVADNVVSNLSYGSFTSYLALSPDVYDLAIRAAGQAGVVATFRADLSGLKGGAATVFASGLLGSDPSFGLFAALPDGAVIALPLTPTARLQVVHNSPSPVVDVYVGNTRLLNDFQFRTATPYVTVPADRNLNIGVAPSTSSSAADAIYNQNIQLGAGKTYSAFASGIVGNPTRPFQLIAFEFRSAAVDTNKVEIKVFHGVTNAPAVDADAVFVANNLVSNLAYGQSTPYLALNPDVYDLAIRPAGSSVLVATLRANLTGLKGKSATVFASGLVGSNPAFGLFVVLADGTVLELKPTPTTRVQIIHNSPNPTVDVYAGNSLLINNFKFRSATPFIDVPSDRNINIGIAGENSTSVNDVLATFPVNFATGKSYTVFASGVLGSPTRPFTLWADANSEESAPAGNVRVSIVHGSPDAPTVNVDERLAGNLVTGLSYGDITPYLSLAPDVYFIDIKLPDNTLVATYFADLSGLDGTAIRVFASGFLGSNPGFGLFAALPNGTVIELPSAPVARVQIIHNSPEPLVDVYANGAKLLDDFSFRSATPFFYVPAGVVVNIGVAPSNSQSASDVIANFPLTFENGKTYFAVASGLLGSTPGFNLLVNDAARERATDPNAVELAILHGIPDAPGVDITDYFTGNLVENNLQYGQFTNYLSLTPDVLALELTLDAAPSPSVGIWGADLSGAAGLTGIVFASGLVSGNPAYDLYIALPDGSTGPLLGLVRAQVIHNSPAPTVDVYLDNGLFLDDFAFHDATNVGLLPARTPLKLSVAPGNSTSVADAIYQLPVDGLDLGNFYIVMAAGVVGSSSHPFQLYVNSQGRYKSSNPVNVDLSVFHGSPDAPSVDVTIPGGIVIFDNIAFGNFTGYLSVPAAQYTIQLTPADDNTTVVKSYIADASSFAGEAAVLYASGYLGSQPKFEVWAAFADGTTFPLPEVVSTKDLNSGLDQVLLAPNPTSDVLNVQLETPDGGSVRYAIWDQLGRMVQEGDWGILSAGSFRAQIQTGALNSGLYRLEIRTDKGIRFNSFVVQR